MTTPTILDRSMAQTDTVIALTAEAVALIQAQQATIWALRADLAHERELSRIRGELKTEICKMLRTSGNVVETRTPDEADASDPDAEVIYLELAVRSVEAPRLRQMIEVSRGFGAKVIA